MAYEIPQQLEYQEKIMFNLTMRQLAYLFLFAPQVLIIFFKTPLSIYFKVILSLIPSSLAIGFIFLHLDTHLLNWYAWFRFRKAESPEQILSFIGVKEIKENTMIMRDKRKVAILKVSSLNFSIKPQTTQETITLMFQKFLNSLDFPVQIMMNTESLNLQDYLVETEKRVDKKFEKLYLEYKDSLEDTVAQNKVMNRNFYVVVPEKTNLDIQIQICEKKLNAIGLKSKRLDSLEILRLLESFFCHAKRIENNPYYLKINETFNKVIVAHGYPRSVESGFLDRIVSCLGNFDFSIHIEPYPIETMMINLNKELQKQSADLYTAKMKGIYNPSLEIKYHDTKTVLENLQKGKEKLFDVSLYINCRAESKEELHLLSKRIESELNALLIIPKTPQFRMAQGFLSCAPLGKNRLKMARNITTEALSAFFPFTSSFLEVDKTGVWLGLNKNNIPIIKDIFKLSNPNGLCLASSGSGKSYMAKLLISRYLLNGVKVMVIDPQGEYRNLVKRFNGQRIDLSRTSETIINPLDLMGHDYPEKRLALMDLMPIMLGDLTEPQKSFIDKALNEAYEDCKITSDRRSWKNEPPVLGDVLHALQDIEKKATAMEKPTVRSLINRLNLYVNGVFSFLNQQTKMDFNNNLVCFDIGNMPKQIKAVMMFLVLDYIYMKMKKDLHRKLLVIDEAWSLMNRAADASYIFEIVKTCRKFNLALFLINQEVEGMLSSEAGKSVLANSSYTLLLRQKPAVIKNIQTVFNLSDSERTTLLTASAGEGVLLMDDEHSEIRIVASEEEHQLITTNPDEILEQSNTEEDILPIKFKKSNKKENTKIDRNARVHLTEKLDDSSIQYLLSQGFKKIKQKDISDKKKTYLVKPYEKESVYHMILTFEIVEYLKKFTSNIQTYRTTQPDIVFESHGKKYAIEVETGKNQEWNKKGLSEKIKSLKDNFGENWFFVVTNRNIVNKYKNHGTTLTKENIRDKLHNLVKGA